MTLKVLLRDAIPVHRFETTAEALTIWRQASSLQPTLLLLSNNPHLSHIPAEFRQKVTTLINDASATTIAAAVTERSADPVILPAMAINAALSSDWFEKLVWVLPLRDPAQELNLGKFTDLLTQSDSINKQEAAALTLAGKAIHGSLGGTSFTATALPSLEAMPQPVIVHIDLGYFQPLYQDEVKTPLLKIIFDTMAALQSMHLKTLAVTFAYGHLDSQIALDARFLGDIISYLIEDPKRLEKPIPLNWRRQSDALYLTNFFQSEKVRQLFEAQEQEDPGAAWIKFNLYRAASNNKEPELAQTYLAKAVAIDPLYAIEYQELGRLAFENGNPEQALGMLKQAAETFNQDPFLKWQIASVAGESGQTAYALGILQQLRKIRWSDIYYPLATKNLRDLDSSLRSQESAMAGVISPDPETGPEAKKEDEARRRILHVTGR